jgi:protein SCO1/2
MKKKQKNKITGPTKIAALSMLILIVTGLIYFSSMTFGNMRALPVLGDPGHVAGSFDFINQDGKHVTDKTVENKVTVVEYFFTSCPSICPTMTRNLKKVYEKFKEDTSFVILSHTVDPERDSSSVLKTYAGKYEATSPGWQFLTGSKDALYTAASRDYLLAVEDSANSNFIHTQYIALLDKKRQVRGFYDMTMDENIKRLNVDIKKLLSE